MLFVMASYWALQGWSRLPHASFQVLEHTFSDPPDLSLEGSQQCYLINDINDCTSHAYRMLVSTEDVYLQPLFGQGRAGSWRATSRCYWWHHSAGHGPVRPLRREGLGAILLEGGVVCTGPAA